MSVNDQNTEPVTDLVLALGYSNRCARGRLSNGSGAGANAGCSRAFVATAPLSELVWSPKKGLSLKCADSSFANTRPSLTWVAGPSYVMLSPSQVKPLEEENLTKSLLPFDMNDEVGAGDTLTKPLRVRTSSVQFCEYGHGETRGTGEQMIMEVESNAQPVDLRISSFLDEQKINRSNGNTCGRARDVSDGDQTSRREVILASQVEPVNDCKIHDTKVQDAASPCSRPLEPAFIDKQNINSNKEAVIEAVLPLDVLESNAGNDMQLMYYEPGLGVSRQMATSEPGREIRNNIWQDEEALPSASSEHSPTSGRIREYQRKGKAKASSDKNVNCRISNDNEESHESVESCNSAGMLSSGKRRWDFEHVENKCRKMHIEDSPGSTSMIKKDSSFMNWISNMMKGFLPANQDDLPDGRKIGNQDLETCNKSRDSAVRNVGFQTIFQSLYCPRTKVQAELQVVHCPENAAFVQYLPSTEKFDGSSLGEEASPAMPQMTFPTGLAACQENSVENKTSCNLLNRKEKDRKSSTSSMSKRKTCSAENIDSKPQSDGKTTNHNGDYRSNLLGSLWISRFAPKTSAPSSDPDACNKISGMALDLSSHGSQDCVGILKDLKILAANQHSAKEADEAMQKESQNFVTDTEASVHLDRNKDGTEKISLNKVNQITPSRGLKVSEAMASIFARRLDAIKHILPSGAAVNEACVTLTCFYCGKKGHHLKECSEVIGAELEELLRNVDASKWMENLHCFCIRCFQCDHWAAVCPSTVLKERHQSGRSACLINDFSSVELQISSRNDKMHLDLNFRGNESTTHHQLISNADSVKRFIASGSGKDRTGESQTMPFYNLVSRQIPGVTKGVFDAIKRLHLSRTDILKWMTTGMPLAHLDGFYLRLRLGQWEEGVGGTGYYVACITESQRESSLHTSQTAISVMVGGIKCLVKSQYISNHDFLEDELLAWWDATEKNGGKIPSEDSLSLKLKERKMLGM